MTATSSSASDTSTNGRPARLASSRRAWSCRSGRGEVVRREQPPEERQRRLDAAHLVLVERARMRRDRLVAIAAPRDQLRDHRVVEDRHRRSRRRRRCRRGCPGPAGARRCVMRPGDGMKPRVGILGVDAALDGVAARRRAPAPDRASAARRARCGSATATRSMPVTISVTGCSTCRRVFISRK